MMRRAALVLVCSILPLVQGDARLGAALIATVADRGGETREPAPGMFLVAARSFLDPHFSQCVIYLLQHDTHASFGVILNRPLPVNLSKRLSGVEGTALFLQPLYDGGPVNPEMLVTLVETGLGKTATTSGWCATYGMMFPPA